MLSFQLLNDPNPVKLDRFQEKAQQLAQKSLAGSCEPGDEEQKDAYTAGVKQVRRELVQKLLKAKADVTATDGSGQTVLHFAALHGHSGVVEVLLKFLTTDAVETRDKNGETPADLACREQHWDVMEKIVNVTKLTLPIVEL